jgi:hypothetical protein
MFSCLVRVCLSTIRISHDPHITTFHRVVNSDRQSHCSWEKWLLTQSTAQQLIDQRVCTQFLSRVSHWSSGGKVTLYWCQTTRLTRPIYQHVIDTFNTCSRGATHRSLTDTGGGYNLGCADFPHSTLRSSQPVIFTFQLRTPPGLQLNYIPPIKLKLSFKEYMAVTRSFDHLTIYHNLPLRVAIANDLFLAIGFTRIDRNIT